MILKFSCYTYLFTVLSLFDGRRNDESDPSSYLWRWDCSRLYSPMRDRHVRPQVGCLHEEDASGTNVSPALRSAANVSSWSGGIAFFLNVAFRHSLKRLNCPPVDLRPSFNTPYSTSRDSRFSGIRMPCPVHLSAQQWKPPSKGGGHGDGSLRGGLCPTSVV